MQLNRSPGNVPKCGSILISFQEDGPAIFFNGESDKKVTELMEFLTSIWSSWASNSNEETVSCS